MAQNGVFYGSTSNQYIKPKIVWSAVQDMAGNYSDVTATLYYSRTNTGYTTGGTWSGSITIDGNTASASKYLEITYDSNTPAITHTVRVYHDNYGNKSLTISADGRITYPSESTLKSTNISAAVTLDTIARATTIGAGKADIESTLLIALDRKNEQFTHSIQYVFGDLSGYIDANGDPTAGEVKLSNANPWFHLPADFYSQIPNSDTGMGTLYCRTYAGDTQIGDTQQAAFYAAAAKDKCGPSLTWNVRDINEKTKALTGNENILIKGHSTAHCEIQGIAQKSAHIASATINNQTVSLDTGAYGALDITPQSGEFSFHVEDTRGYACTVPAARSFINYIDLTCNATAVRTDPTSGNAILNVWGQYFNGSFTAVRNTLSIRYKVDDGDYMTVEAAPGDADYSVTVPLEGLDYQQSHKIQVVAEDRLTTLTKTVTLGKGIPVFDWGESDFAFRVPVAAPSLNGIFIEPVRVWGTGSFTLQTEFAAFNGVGDDRQSIFLFGCDNGILLHGVIGINDAGSVSWSGTEGVSVAAGENGVITVNLPCEAWDWFTLISAEYFSI